MAIWAEASREAMFKRVDGGFIFRVGGLIPHHYLVTEAQKAEIQRIMRTQFCPTPKGILLFVLLLVGIFFLIVVGLSVSRLVFGQPYRSVILAILILSPGVINLICGPVIRRSTLKRLGPVLEGAQHTKQKITWRDRNETYARMSPMSALLGVAVGSAVLFTVSIFAVIATFFSSHFPTYLIDPSERDLYLLDLILFAPIAGFFFYLAILKLSLRRSE